MQLLMIIFSPFPLHAMQHPVVGLFANQLTMPVRLYNGHSTFLTTVKPNEQIPLRTDTFIVYTANNTTLKETAEEKFYSWTYFDKEGNEKLFTFECIQNWQHASSVFNVKTGNLRPQDSSTVEFLKERLAQIKLYNSN